MQSVERISACAYDICSETVLSEIVQVISMPQVILVDYSAVWPVKSSEIAYWRPIRLKVRSAMRTDSVEPLIVGVPVHDAA